MDGTLSSFIILILSPQDGDNFLLAFSYPFSYSDLFNLRVLPLDLLDVVLNTLHVLEHELLDLLDVLVLTVEEVFLIREPLLILV